MKKLVQYLSVIIFLLSSLFVPAQENKIIPLRWSEEKANEWYKKVNWGGGFNYVPSTAANTTEMWQKENFDPVTIDRELRWARDLGYSSARVFLQYIVWKDNAAEFRKRFDQ